MGSQSRPKVLVDAAIPDEPLTILEGAVDILRYGAPRELDALIDAHDQQIVGLGVLLSTSIDGRLLDRLQNLRIIANYAVGVDNVDLAAAAARGVLVTNTPDVLTDATADLTWALILAVARRLREGEAFLRGGGWSDWQPQRLLGRELKGGNLAVLGLGRIGAAVSRRALGFGMNLLYWNRSAKPALERELGILRRDLDQAVAEADVVSIHLPLTSETHHLIDGDRLRRMKRDAILVNTARGPIVDEEALADALEDGRLFGVGLDVYENEPQVHPVLLTHPRTVLLPHLGSATTATRTAMAWLVAKNLHAALTGHAPPSPVVEQ